MSKECSKLIEENKRLIENYTTRNKFLEQQHIGDKKDVSKLEKLLVESKKEIEELKANSERFKMKYEKLKMDITELLSFGEGVSGGVFVQVSQSSSQGPSQLTQSQQLVSPITPFSSTAATAPFPSESNKTQEEEIQSLRNQLETSKVLLDKRCEESAKLESELKNIQIHYTNDSHVKKTATYMELQKCYDTLFKLYDLERSRVSSLEKTLQSMSREFKEKHEARKNESKTR